MMSLLPARELNICFVGAGRFQIVGEASNGQEGLEMIEKYQPEIVLADIVMPVLNGIDFSLILQEKYPDIKLIILSSYDNFEYVRTTLLNGAVDYVLKPTLNPEILLRALKKAARGFRVFSWTGRKNRCQYPIGEISYRIFRDAGRGKSEKLLSVSELPDSCSRYEKACKITAVRWNSFRK